MSGDNTLHVGFNPLGDRDPSNGKNAIRFDWACLRCPLRMHIDRRDLRPRLTAQEYADARSRFIAALRSRAGEGAVDCGVELEDVFRRGDKPVSPVAVCVRNAWENRKPFYILEEQRIYCPQFSGYAGDGSGKV